MSNDKINLMVINSEKINNASGIFEMNIHKKCNALNLTLIDQELNVKKVNKCRKLITSKASIFSNFRGNTLLTTALNLSLDDNPKESFNEIMNIYDKLKTYFFTTQFLVLAAQIIYNSRYILDVDVAIQNTKITYDLMNKNSCFFTSSDDVSCAALIATNSTNLEKTFIDLNECYDILKEHNFTSGNSLKSLLYTLSFSTEHTVEKCNKVISLHESLKKQGIPLRGYALPFLGVASLITDNYNSLAKDIFITDNNLKKQPGFGTFSLGYTIRSMISAALTCSSYIDDLEEPLNTSLNIATVLQIAANISSALATSITNSEEEQYNH